MTGYARTRDRLEAYFDRTAAETWARLTSEAPVSRIRATVRAGRARMRAALLERLPADLTGARVLDAGCGTGALSADLAGRGAEVVGVDVAPRLLAVARARVAPEVAGRIDFRAGDMLAGDLGRFDHVVAMDSLIHYAPGDAARALVALAARCEGRVVFTVAPKTPLLSAMHLAGKAFPKSDRSPAIVPVSERRLSRELARGGAGRDLVAGPRVATGFYISRAMELAPSADRP